MANTKKVVPTRKVIPTNKVTITKKGGTYKPSKLAFASMILGYVSFVFLVVGGIFWLITDKWENIEGKDLGLIAAIIIVISHLLVIAYAIITLINDKKSCVNESKIVRNINKASGIGSLIAIVVTIAVGIFYACDNGLSMSDMEGLAAILGIFGIIDQVFVLLGAIANSVWLKKTKKASK